MSENNKGILIVQLARLGDLVQTAIAARQFKIENPQIPMGLVARGQFARPLKFLLEQCFDKIFYLDLDQLICSPQSANLHRVLGAMQSHFEEIDEFQPWVSINLTFSKSSSLYMGLLKSPHKLGPWRVSLGTPQIRDSWGQYLYSTTQRGPLNPFSLVDIFARILGVQKAPLAHQIFAIPEVKAQEYFSPTQINESSNRKILFLHPFGSDPKKCWPLSEWAKLIKIILEDAPLVDIALVGAQEEQQKCKDLLHLSENQNHPRLYNLVGQVDLYQLTGLLKSGDALVGHDSLVGHLSSLVDLPALTLSVGSVRPWETSPYRAGNLNLAAQLNCFPCFPDKACDDWKCQKAYDPNCVANLALQLLFSKGLDPQLAKKNAEILNKNSACLSMVRRHQHFGHLMTPLFPQYDSLSWTFRNFYALIWSFMLSDRELNIDYPQLDPNSIPLLNSYKEALDAFYELNEFGRHYSQVILKELQKEKQDLKEISQLSQKLSEVDSGHNKLITKFPLLSPLIDFFILERANLGGKTLLELAHGCYQSYSNANQCLSVLDDLITKTIKSNTQGIQSDDPDIPYNNNN